MRWLIVGAGGCVGAIARFGISLFVARFWSRDFPLATFLINVSGSFVLGLFSTLAVGRLALAPEWRLFVSTGVVGAYTTFSTFEYETARLSQTGAGNLALLNVLASVVAGYLAVRLGILLGR